MSFVPGPEVRLDRPAYVDPTARIFGRVSAGEGSSFWPYSVIRAEGAGVRIGRCCNIQDGAVIHVGGGRATTIGDYCSIAHRAVVHGAEVGDDCLVGIGAVEVAKTPGSGGRLDIATCTEQLLYEMHDPSAYITPDCVLDASDVTFRQVAHDRVALNGARGKPRTPTYKVVVGYFDGYMGSGEMGFAGINAVARARLGIDVVKERLRRRGLNYEEMRIDLIGMNSLHANDSSQCPEPYEVRLRIAARTPDRKAAEAVGAEVRSLHMQGPTGAGGGVNFGARQILAVKSVLIPREWVKPEIVLERAA